MIELALTIAAGVFLLILGVVVLWGIGALAVCTWDAIVHPDPTPALWRMGGD